jgi:hypothetical protein
VNIKCEFKVKQKMQMARTTFFARPGVQRMPLFRGHMTAISLSVVMATMIQQEADEKALLMNAIGLHEILFSTRPKGETKEQNNK